MPRSRLLRYTVHITALNFRTRLQYRGAFILEIARGILWQTSVLLMASVILVRFPGMAGWPSSGILLIAGLRLLSHALYVMIFGNIVAMPFMAQDGRIDGYLTRPLPVLLQVLTSSFNVAAFGDLLVATALLTSAVLTLPIAWHAAQVLFLVGALFGGTLLEAAIQTTIAGLALRRPGSDLLAIWVDDIMATFGSYPLNILPTAGRMVLTFVLPLAFIAYFPAAVLVGRTEGSGVPHLLAVLSPVLGPLLFALSQWWWRRSLRHYTSPGG
jgi:ABC-2 type transport system permease protein